MDQPYSAWADWLNKCHSSSECIQALWLVTIPVTLLGLAWIVLHGIRAFARQDRGTLIYGVYQDRCGRWMVYRHGRKPQEVDWTNPPPGLIGPAAVIQGVFGRPEA